MQELTSLDETTCLVGLVLLVDWLLRVHLWILVKLLLMVKLGGRGYELVLSLDFLWLLELLSRLDELLLLELQIKQTV